MSNDDLERLELPEPAAYMLITGCGTGFKEGPDAPDSAIPWTKLFSAYQVNAITRPAPVEVTEAMVERACIAASEDELLDLPWADYGDDEKTNCRRVMRAALEAALGGGE